MGVILKERAGRKVSEVCLEDGILSKLEYNERDLITVKVRDLKEEW